MFDRPAGLEAFVLELLARAEVAGPTEDQRIELKSRWIDARTAARLLAGQANAAHGESVLWIVGVDEKGSKVVGAGSEELASWYPQLVSEFDGVAPQLIQNLVVPVGDLAVVALVFSTNRAPYVIRNPDFGKSKTRISHETPWREGNATRTARREDLFRILAPAQALPKIEILHVEIGARETTFTIDDAGVHAISWGIEVGAYFTPKDAEPCTFPFHRAWANIQLVGTEHRVPMSPLRLGFELINTVIPPANVGDATAPRVRDSEVVLAGPSKLLISGGASTEFFDIPDVDANLLLHLEVANSDLPFETEVGVARGKTRPEFLEQWVLRPRRQGLMRG